jgi:hypothetical protein
MGECFPNRTGLAKRNPSKICFSDTDPTFGSRQLVVGGKEEAARAASGIGDGFFGDAPMQ